MDRSQRFFDRYPRFYDTTGTLLKPNRFEQRWRMIIDRHADLLRGARVLDLASHDGRWSFAALMAGARHVVGVEGRPEMVGRARDNFLHYGISPDQGQFHVGDAVTFLNRLERGNFDVVLNLGFFYHTMRHQEIMEAIANTGADVLILDTGLAGDPRPIVELGFEAVDDLRNAVDHRGTGAARALVGVPSRAALALMAQAIDFGLAEVDWHAHIEDFRECEDYEARQRGTFLLRRAQ